jgi:hypothetical protein
LSSAHNICLSSDDTQTIHIETKFVNKEIVNKKACYFSIRPYPLNEILDFAIAGEKDAVARLGDGQNDCQRKSEPYCETHRPKKQL